MPEKIDQSLLAKVIDQIDQEELKNFFNTDDSQEIIRLFEVHTKPLTKKEILEKFNTMKIHFGMLYLQAEYFKKKSEEQEYVIEKAKQGFKVLESANKELYNQQMKSDEK